MSEATITTRRALALPRADVPSRPVRRRRGWGRTRLLGGVPFLTSAILHAALILVATLVWASRGEVLDSRGNLTIEVGALSEIPLQREPPAAEPPVEPPVVAPAEERRPEMVPVQELPDVSVEPELEELTPVEEALPPRDLSVAVADLRTRPRRSAPTPPPEPPPALTRPYAPPPARPSPPPPPQRAGGRPQGAIVLLRSPQYYPPEAQQRGLQGTVTVVMTVASTGHVLNVQLERSSGYAVLDEAALGSARQYLFGPRDRSWRVRRSFTFSLR